MQNSIEIIVDLGKNNQFNFSTIKGSKSHYQYLVIEPNRNVKAKYIYGVKQASSLATGNNNTENKKKNANNLVFGDDNAVSLYDMLSELRNTKIVPENDTIKAQAELDRIYTVYQYYFKGEVIMNEYTGLVETVKFTILQDTNF